MPQSSTSARKQAIKNSYNKIASSRSGWIDKNKFYYDDEVRYLKFIIPEGLRVLEVGCGTGHLLSALKPIYGVGIDISKEMIGVARDSFGEYEFVEGDSRTEKPYTMITQFN